MNERCSGRDVLVQLNVGLAGAHPAVRAAMAAVVGVGLGATTAAVLTMASRQAACSVR